MFFIIQSTNFLNFLINKDNRVFAFIATLLVSLIALQKFTSFDASIYSQQVFDAIVANPILALVPVILAVVLYYINYKQLRERVYLDDVVAVKHKKLKLQIYLGLID